MIRDRIAVNYENTLHPELIIKVFALRFDADVPLKPDINPQFFYSSAVDFFKYFSNLFVGSRYFFEQVPSGQWSFMPHPIGPMILMLDALYHTYDALIQDAQRSGPDKT